MPPDRACRWKISAASLMTRKFSISGQRAPFFDGIAKVDGHPLLLRRQPSVLTAAPRQPAKLLELGHGILYIWTNV